MYMHTYFYNIVEKKQNYRDKKQVKSVTARGWKQGEKLPKKGQERILGSKGNVLCL